MTLTEMKYLYLRNRISVNVADVIEYAERDYRIRFYPLDMSVVESIPMNLNIHDAITCATALVQQRESDEEVRVVTRDQEIIDSAIVATLW